MRRFYSTTPNRWLIEHAVKEFHFVKGPRFVWCSRLSASAAAANLQSLSERGHSIELHVLPLGSCSRSQRPSIISVGPYDLVDDAEQDMQYIIANVPSLYHSKT